MPSQFKRPEFNDGKGYHGSKSVMNGRLKGRTDGSDYFYFECPHCKHVLRLLEYGEHLLEPGHDKNEFCESEARYTFVLVFKSYCEHCNLHDFVKVSNDGPNWGRLSNMHEYPTCSPPAICKMFK